MLTGKVALVTGASGGIGQEIVRAFVREGAYVIATDRQEEDLVVAFHDASDRVRCFSLDLKATERIPFMVDEALAWRGKIDILVNNAGVVTQNPLETTTLEEWNETLYVNLTTAFLLSKLVVPGMKENGFGRIINMASTGGKNTASITGSAYAVSKAALIFLTKRAAYEWGPYGITVNGVAPGAVMTKMSATFSEERMAELLRQMRIKRMGTPVEVAELIVYLASEAAGYITGEIIDMNGGSFID